MTAVRKKRLLWLLLALLLAAALTALFFALHFVQDGRVYRRGAATLDLRDESLTVEQYQALRARLPDCRIRWSVPIGSGRYDSEAEELTVTDFSAADVELFTLFPHLTRIDAGECGCRETLFALEARLPDCDVYWTVALGDAVYEKDAASLTLGPEVGYDELQQRLRWLPALQSVQAPELALTPTQQRALLAAYPELDFLWPVTLCGQVFLSDERALSFAGQTGLTAESLTALGENALLLPQLERIDLTGCGLDQEALLSLADALPQVQVVWDTAVYGVAFSTDATELYFNDIPIADLAPLEALLPHMHSLTWVELCNCGPDNDAMDALCRRYPAVRFIWVVNVGVFRLRTDAVGFNSNSINGAVVVDETAQNLRYCTDMLSLDLGHEPVTDYSFLRAMPHLRYLIAACSSLGDLSELAGLQELEMIEIQLCPGVSDLTPLLSCPRLLDINLGYIQSGHGAEYLAVLSQMTQLERLWYSEGMFTPEQEQALRDALPNCTLFRAENVDQCGFNGWRRHYHYYEMRDLQDMFYMGPGGVNYYLVYIEGRAYLKPVLEAAGLWPPPNGYRSMLNAEEFFDGTGYDTDFAYVDWG